MFDNKTVGASKVTIKRNRLRSARSNLSEGHDQRRLPSLSSESLGGGIGADLLGQNMRLSRRSPCAIMRMTALVLLSFTLTGCATHVADVPPAVLADQTFSGEGGDPLPERWWHSFSDTVLNELIEEGMAGSPDLAVWWARLDQTRAMARKAGADLWPSLDLDGQASRSGEWREGESETFTNAMWLGATMSYEIDLWGGIRSAREAAAFNAAASREDVLAAEITLSSRIASTWYELAEAKGQIAVLEEQALANEQVLELVTLNFRRGKVGASDVLRQRQLLESNSGDLSLARARLSILRHQLAVLLGRSSQDPVNDAAASLINLPPLPRIGLPAELLRTRPDVRSAFLSVASAHASTAAAVAERYPRISLSGRVSTGGSEASNVFTDWLGNLAANLVTPLIDGGERRAEVARRRAESREALGQYRLVVLAAVREVEDALVKERQQRAHMESLESQLELAGAVVERTRDAYLGGHADYLRVLDALISQQLLQRRVLAAHRLLIQYRIDLSRALGCGWTLHHSAGADTPVEVRNDQ